MQLFITKKIGKRTFNFVVEGNDLHMVVMESEHLSFDDVPACGLCGSTNLTLTARVAQNKYKYVSVKCLDCRGDVTFGKRQEDDKVYFLRKKEGGERGELDWKAYDKNAVVE
ncbi:hypothetical protein [Hymenobacter sp. YC55]|uniref:hypothetical protein n=1 Tax=Hymenobacter sp. YC55 TaxID=3034019 RepID=UPI0023F93F3F|nr:hypothetical protein [Hymenobacter sp. YC55]MDF7815286.1 hypothetical protein [Hymenobacter sp. YC55]